MLLIAILSCTQATRTGVESARPSLGAAGALLSNIGNATKGIFESQTVSLALDRIDQRNLPLDHTYRRSGSGQGVTVYVFDGGVLDSHPELEGRVRKGYDAFPSDPRVCNAHGTAVAGAIAGKTLGVAPRADIVDVKMVECTRLRGTIKAIVEGTLWVLEDHKRHGGGPAVANWSFIADTSSHIPQLDSAVAELRAAGIPVIVSAGNIEINACRVSPGNAPGSIVVGASAVNREPGETKVSDRRAINTAWGPCIDVYAPGDSVLLPSFDSSRSPSVQLWNGTSMSAGYVSGAVALYLESNPKASPDDVLAHLRSSATPNVVKDTNSPFSYLLYVGQMREEMRSVEEIRAAQLAKRR